MTNAISVSFTYEQTTPESVAEGNFSDNGFCNNYGDPITDKSFTTEMIRHTDVNQWSELGDLEYLIRQAINWGISEPSDTFVSSNTWFSSVDADVSYITGQETHYSLHISGLSDQQMQRVAKILEQGYVGEENEYWLECTERDIITASFFSTLDPSILQQAKAILVNIGRPEDNESLLVALCANLSHLLPTDQLEEASDLYGLYR